MSVEYRKENQSKVGFSITQNISSLEKESDCFIFHYKIEQSYRLMRNTSLRTDIQGTYNKHNSYLNKLQDSHRQNLLNVI